MGARKTVAATQLAFYLARGAIEAAVEGPQALHSIIQSCERPPKTNRVQYWIELYLICFFPLDLIAAGELGKQADEVRAYTRELIRLHINEQRTRNELGALSTARWEDLVSKRFSDYADALAPVPGRGDGAGLMAYSNLAAKLLAGQEEADIQVSLHIGIQFSTMMKHMPEVIRGYHVV